jgi:uncharacterized protein (DUF58 family)
MMQSPVAEIAKLDYVINAVAAAGLRRHRQRRQSGLMTFADDVQHYLSPRQGRGQFYRMLELLYAVEAQPVEPDYTAPELPGRPSSANASLVIIFTDLTSGPA